MSCGNSSIRTVSILLIFNLQEYPTDWIMIAAAASAISRETLADALVLQDEKSRKE